MIIVGFFIACYCILMIRFLIGFYRVSEFQFLNAPPKISFSVIVPFRNESERLPGLLTSINELNYPLEHVEFIFVDDDSSDNSVEIIAQYAKELKQASSIRILQNIRTSASPKKDAIQTAIQHAAYEWIITTDADCSLPKNWLQCYNAYIQKHDVIMIVGPVRYYKEPSFLSMLQRIEFHTLQAVTMGSFGIDNAMMCNGANLAYTKSAFLSVNGFQDNNTIASGDDVFLFEKMYQKDKKKVHYLKSKAAVVSTAPEKTWKSFLEQRVRWASKSSHYKNPFTKFAGLIVALGNLGLITGILLTIFQVFTYGFLLIVFLVKAISDILLYLRFNRFFAREQKTSFYIISSFVYPFLSVFILILTLFSGYTWKGRHFMK